MSQWENIGIRIAEKISWSRPIPKLHFEGRPFMKRLSARDEFARVTLIIRSTS
jgi:hypothetical protein